MKALDLFCCAGGASEGLRRAGFDVTGVDIRPQPHHSGGRFIQADALTFPLTGYDFIWASPPCQCFTAYRRRPDHVKDAQNLIPNVRQRLVEWGGMYVIENVHGAPLHAPFMLCGSSFGLDVRRHRYFETNMTGIVPPSCQHHKQVPRFPPATNRQNLRCTVEIGVWRIPLAVQQKAMGIDWMPLRELSQAIPPAYAEWIGLHAMKAMKRLAPRRSRPRRRNPYRDNVLTVPATPERHELEEAKIREAWKASPW